MLDYIKIECKAISRFYPVVFIKSIIDFGSYVRVILFVFVAYNKKNIIIAK